MISLENLKIEEAKENDISSLIELYAQLDSDSKLTVKEAVEILNTIKRYPNYSVYVAKLNDKIAGAFELLIMDNFAHKGAKSGIIEDVVVDISMRSKGIGREMMKYAMKICRENKCYKLVLSSNLKREKAHKFYEDLGFVKHGYSFQIDILTNK
jgi:GNAT superfamily N-acetyltransferase